MRASEMDMHIVQLVQVTGFLGSAVRVVLTNRQGLAALSHQANLDVALDVPQVGQNHEHDQQH